MISDRNLIVCKMSAATGAVPHDNFRALDRVLNFCFRHKLRCYAVSKFFGIIFSFLVNR